MSFFNRKSPDPAPEWTSFTDNSEFEEFISLVKKYFDRKKLKYTIDQDAIMVNDSGWPVSTMGLSNLAQICKQSPRSAWKSLVNEHFDTLLKKEEFESAFYAKAHDYSYASPYIGVRVYPKGYIAHVGEEYTISQPISEDLVALLVFDFPHMVSNIKPETTVQWNKTNEELYDIGLANMRMRYKSQVSSEDVNGTRIWIIQGDHFFVANSVLELHLQPIPTGAYGSLVGIPHRHAVLVYPIDNLDLMKVLQPFIFILNGMHQEGPGSISDSLYWYRYGKLTALPYSLKEEELQFKPPDAFFDMINSLPEKK